MASQRQDSRKEWESNSTRDEFAFGALQRIADATELMEKNHLQLEKDLKWWKARAERFEQQLHTAHNEARTLRGVITRHRNERDRLKAKIAAINNSTQNPAQ